jgi:hypothetical protein
MLSVNPFESQRYLSVHRQQEGLCVKNDRRWRVFAGKHLEAGQYVAQSRLDLHKREPHPCEQNQKLGYQEDIRNREMSFQLTARSLQLIDTWYVFFCTRLLISYIRHMIFIEILQLFCFKNFTQFYIGVLVLIATGVPERRKRL